MASALKTSGHLAFFSLLARAAFMAAQNSTGQKRLEYLQVMVGNLEAASMFGEGVIGCAEVGIPIEEVVMLRNAGERQVYRAFKKTPTGEMVSASESNVKEALSGAKFPPCVIWLDEGNDKGRSN
jgi:hypothetical protein